MAGTTTRRGLPYPTGGDRVMDGDNAIQALAEALDNSTINFKAIAAGLGVIPSSPTNASTVAITYPVGRFTAQPQFVGVTMASNSTTYTMYGVGGNTASGFTAHGGSNSGAGTMPSPLSFYWIALQI